MACHSLLVHTAAPVEHSSLLPRRVEVALKPLQLQAAALAETETSELVEQLGSPSQRVIRISVPQVFLPLVVVLVVLTRFLLEPSFLQPSGTEHLYAQPLAYPLAIRSHRLGSSRRVCRAALPYTHPLGLAG